MAVLTAVWVTAHTALGARFKTKDKQLSYRLRRQMIGCRAVCKAVNMHVWMTDQSAAIKDGTLVVCNHFSAMDPLILGTELPVCFAGKADIDNLPILGWVCRTHGMLLVDRKRRRAALELTGQIKARLQQGLSVLVFSEGTTGDGDVLLPFKSGTFACMEGWADGHVQPAFLDVTAINSQPVDGPNGRAALSHNRHPGLLRHLLHLYGHHRIDFAIRTGPPMETAIHDRKSLARAAHEQVERLAINTTTTK